MSDFPVWDDRGHLSEVALVALADGQLDLVSDEARAHVDGCEACARALADLALQSSVTTRALAPLRAERSVHGREPPVVAIAVALVLAVIGALPSLSDPSWSSRLASAPHAWLFFASGIARGLGAIAREPAGTVATFLAAVLLSIAGALVARQQRRAHMES